MRKAIAYTVIGGIGLLALTGGVVVASEALEQRTDGGQILDGGAVTGDYTGGAVGRDLRSDQRGATPTPRTPTPTPTSAPPEQSEPPAQTEPEHLPPAPPVEVDDDPDTDVDDDVDVDDDADDVDED
ncbi:hypothetical protein QMO46_07490 [Microbacterium barkeri]|uniref:hypothetical protein n=1 Tax=Microbacterium barkeri TaxID=33917 RepID=UPI0024AF8307|nr:hypothetical protein [Microbacterium barkeri]MDI6943337.1 hypothetical protein [Microbacterium barkeri]